MRRQTVSSETLVKDSLPPPLNLLRRSHVMTTLTKREYSSDVDRGRNRPSYEFKSDYKWF